VAGAGLDLAADGDPVSVPAEAGDGQQHELLELSEEAAARHAEYSYK
jgi:hypothetical protein